METYEYDTILPDHEAVITDCLCGHIVDQYFIEPPEVNLCVEWEYGQEMH